MIGVGRAVDTEVSWPFDPAGGGVKLRGTDGRGSCGGCLRAAGLVPARESGVIAGTVSTSVGVNTLGFETRLALVEFVAGGF